MRGFRNVGLILAYLLWAGVVVLMFRPPGGVWSPELITAAGTFLGVTGTTHAAMIAGRALNKWAEQPKGGPSA